MSDETCNSQTKVTDLDEDTLAKCASYLSLRDLSNMAISCKSLKLSAYNDAVWHRWFREHWPLQQPSGNLQTEGIREAYIARRTAVQGFRFSDPLLVEFHLDPKPFENILMNERNIILSQGPLVRMMKIGSFLDEGNYFVTLNDHNARVTCMRSFPLSETFFSRNDSQRGENVLITSSCDHSIRLWCKGTSQRCLRGHSGPVSTLSDRLLGDGADRVLASGGEDGTVRLWSLGSSGRRGKHALKATLFGHEQPIRLISVAGHKSYLLVSISKSKVRVWDANASSAVRSASCVGMTTISGIPVNMKCHESLLFVGAGSSVFAVDLRTMQKVMTSALHQPMYSFQIIPSRSLICTGGSDTAMLWDIRRNQENWKPKPIAELDGHAGPVKFLHMDPYKIVTGGPDDRFVRVWEVDTGKPVNSLTCTGEESDLHACSAMAVHGSRIVTASCNEDLGILCYRDFNNSTSPVWTCESQPSSKFWGSQSDSDTDNEHPQFY